MRGFSQATTALSLYLLEQKLLDPAFLARQCHEISHSIASISFRADATYLGRSRATTALPPSPFEQMLFDSVHHAVHKHNLLDGAGECWTSLPEGVVLRIGSRNWLKAHVYGPLWPGAIALLLP